MGSDGVVRSRTRAAQVPIEHFAGHLSQPRLVCLVDVAEIFGGVGGVGKLAVRRRLRCGEPLTLSTASIFANLLTKSMC